MSLPPLSLEYIGATDWGRPCELRDCDRRIPAANALRITDRIHTEYCPSCALTTDPELATLANALEHSWQLILASHETPHFMDAARVLRGMAGTVDALEAGTQQVHTRVRPDVALTVHAARPAGWEPPYPNWPAGDDEN